jgi:hypothetical protein
MALAVVVRNVAEKWHLTYYGFQEEGHMEKASKGVTWICIFSTLLTGCYSSATVGPDSFAEVRLHHNRIIYVVTKDGTRYDFDKQPTVTEKGICGDSNVHVEGGFVRRPVVISPSDVAQICVKELDGPDTTRAVLWTVAIVAVVTAVLVVANNPPFQGNMWAHSD